MEYMRFTWRSLKCTSLLHFTCGTFFMKSSNAFWSTPSSFTSSTSTEQSSETSWGPSSGHLVLMKFACASTRLMLSFRKRSSHEDFLESEFFAAYCSLNPTGKGAYSSSMRWCRRLGLFPSSMA